MSIFDSPTAHYWTSMPIRNCRNSLRGAPGARSRGGRRRRHGTGARRQRGEKRVSLAASWRPRAQPRGQHSRRRATPFTAATTAAATLAALLGPVTLGARIDLATLPLTAAARRHLDTHGDWPRLPSVRGDMELCFSVPAPAHAELIAWASASRTPVTRVARVDASAAVTLVDGAGRPLPDWNAVPVGNRS